MKQTASLPMQDSVPRICTDLSINQMFHLYVCNVTIFFHSKMFLQDLKSRANEEFFVSTIYLTMLRRLDLLGKLTNQAWFPFISDENHTSFDENLQKNPCLFQESNSTILLYLHLQIEYFWNY
ncbi:hypothetical protein E2320_011553 [Naja naja]|nr:hypothetical protein E2320_011553 [Naja naja]